MRRLLHLVLSGLLLVEGASLAKGKNATHPVGKATGKATGKNTARAAPHAMLASAPLPQVTAPTGNQVTVLPTGSGIPASALQGVNWRTMTSAPSFLSDLKMPSAPAQTQSLMHPATSAISHVQVDYDPDLKTQITQNKATLQSIFNSRSRKTSGPQSTEALADMLVTAFKGAMDPSARGVSTAPAATTGMHLSMAPGRRLLNIWDDIAGFFEDVGCGAFATASLPAYLLAYTLFLALNPNNYFPLSTHQEFFQRSIYQWDVLSAVDVHYSSSFPPFFGSAAAVTMGHHIYVRSAAARFDTNTIWQMSLANPFLLQTQLLNHELGHSVQYKNRNWNLAVFGWDYLNQYCKAGFSYSKNSMEVDAETHRYMANAIMSGQALAHFKKWRLGAFWTQAGFSGDRVEHDAGFSVGNTPIKMLTLVHVGSSKTGESQRKQGTYCVRILWGTAMQNPTRTQANIPGHEWQCMDVKPTPAPTEQPTLFANGWPFSPTKPTAPTAPTKPTTYYPTHKLT